MIMNWKCFLYNLIQCFFESGSFSRGERQRKSRTPDKKWYIVVSTNENLIGKHYFYHAHSFNGQWFNASNKYASFIESTWFRLSIYFTQTFYILLTIQYPVWLRSRYFQRHTHIQLTNFCSWLTENHNKVRKKVRFEILLKAW